MLGSGHVDEVGDDNAAQIAQAQLARNGLSGFQVGFENRVFEIARTDISAGVHVHCGQGFGLVDDQVTTRFQVYPAAQRLGNFFVDRIQVKDRPLALVMLQALGCFGHELLTKRLKLGKLLL